MLNRTGVRVGVVGTVGIPACYGGFETLIENLVDCEKFDFTVYCSSKEYSNKRQSYKGAKLKYIPLGANGVQSILYDFVSIVDAARRRNAVILVLGISGAIAIPFVRVFSRAKIVTNIDGLEWRRAKWAWFAKRYLKFAEWVAVKCSHCVISDNQAIAEYVLNEYGLQSTMIAYGGDHGIVGETLTAEGDYALSICRIEPENNVCMILEAFARSGQALKFVGNWDSSEYGRRLKAKYAKCKNIDIMDPVYQPEKLYALREGCGIYIHGHSAGGTNPSLVEIMHFGKCVVAFDCDYNRATTEGKARYFSTEEDLMRATCGSEAECAAIGGAMLEIARRRYTWDIVREQYSNVFLSV